MLLFVACTGMKCGAGELPSRVPRDAIALLLEFATYLHLLADETCNNYQYNKENIHI